ncbi:MAG: potassium transporter Trk [Candidatus Cloacimonetes bacterium]|nr:potassium transporter Trk [Candidatus Cloacimonadota bacterium]
MKKFIYNVETGLYSLLNILAILNFQFLFLKLVRIEARSNYYYTIISIALLLLYILFRLFRHGFSFGRLRDVSPDLLFIGIGLFVADSHRVFQFYLLGRQTFILIRNMALSGYKGKFIDKLSDNPPVFVLFSFFLAIFIGTLLLLLPSATVPGEETSLIGGLFTSTSATCVTGLIVYDTGSHFTFFGQMIILFLIQIGGLGIMTVSSAFAIMLGQRLSIKSESVIQNVVGESSKIDMIRLVKNIIAVTFIFELIGALLLYLTFHDRFTQTGEAIYCSVFHSISAFCNAGFCLFKNNLMEFKSNFNINAVITSLIILGGIGFPVLVDIRANIMGGLKLSRFSLHSKIVLTCTLILILAGLVCFFIAEYNDTMKGFSLQDRLFASYFQSVTARTAGFNTIDNSLISKPSVLITIILMFIGASPGSTGGGIKTTAFVIIVVSVLAMLKGYKDVNVFKRKVADDIIRKVMALITASLALLSILIFLLLIIEPFAFERTVFEAFSAFGTVGLSMGITPYMSEAGKMIIILLMYLGRVGPLTLIFAISETKSKSYYSYTEEKIGIG